MSLKVIITDVITNVISNVINLLFTPIDVAGLTFWTKAKILARSGWPTATDQLKNEVGAPHLQLNTGSAIRFQSATQDHAIASIGSTLAYPFSLRQKMRVDCFGSGNLDVISSIFDLDSVNNQFVITKKIDNSIEIRRRDNNVTSFVTTVVGYTVPNGTDFIDFVVCYKSATEFDFYANASLIGSFTVDSVPLGGLIDSLGLGIFRAVSPSYVDVTIQLAQIYNSGLSAAQVLELHNNPQISIPDGTTALVNLSLEEGKYLDGDIAINEGTGSNATVLTTGVATYDMAVNGLSDGYQKSLGGININSGRTIISTNPTSAVDIEGSPISNPWKTGRINCIGGLHGGTTAINVGNTRTIAFGLYVADASVDQTIFETGSNDITLTSSAIASADFSIIAVDRGANALTDGSWHYVELQNGSDVALTALRLKENFDGIIIPFDPFTGQISEADSISLYTYFQTLY